MRILLVAAVLCNFMCRHEVSWKGNTPDVQYLQKDTLLPVSRITSQTFRYDGRDWKVLSKSKSNVQIFNRDGKVRTIPATSEVRMVE